MHKNALTVHFGGALGTLLANDQQRKTIHLQTKHVKSNKTTRGWLKTQQREISFKTVTLAIKVGVSIKQQYQSHSQDNRLQKVQEQERLSK